MSLHIYVESDVLTPEDYYARGSRYAFVFDGLGGTGSRKRSNASGDTWPEAKIASRAAASGLDRLMAERLDAWTAEMDLSSLAVIETKIGEISEEISRCMQDTLAAAAIEWNAQEGKLPTTIAGWIAFPMPDGRTLAAALWAGDSRCYLLDAERMLLCTQDDADEASRRDAMMDCLVKDSLPMNRRLGIDAKYANCELSHRWRIIDRPSLLMSCTDGFYNCSESPMHFECYVRQLGGQESVEDMQEAWKEFILSDFRFQDDSATLETIFINNDPDDLNALRLTLGGRFDEIKEKYIDTFPTEEYEEYADIDSLVGKASRTICDKDDKYHFFDSLRDFALRCAMGEATCPEDMPCLNAIRMMQSDFTASKKKKEDEETEIKRKISAAEEALDRELDLVHKTIYSIQWPPHTIPDERRTLPGKRKQLEKCLLTHFDNILLYCDYLSVKGKLRDWDDWFDEPASNRPRANRPPFPNNREMAFQFMEQELLGICAGLDSLSNYYGLSIKLEKVRTGNPTLQKHIVSLNMEERNRLKEALKDAAVEGLSMNIPMLNDIHLPASDCMKLIVTAMAYGAALREYDRFVLTKTVRPPSADCLDEFLARRPYADARYIIELMLDKHLTLDMLPVNISVELKGPLEATVKNLRQKKEERAASFRRLKEIREQQIALWEDYRTEFEAFNIPVFIGDAQLKVADRQPDGKEKGVGIVSEAADSRPDGEAQGTDTTPKTVSQPSGSKEAVYLTAFDASREETYRQEAPDDAPELKDPCAPEWTGEHCDEQSPKANTAEGTERSPSKAIPSTTEVDSDFTINTEEPDTSYYE